jgi:hypothetical protein
VQKEEPLVVYERHLSKNLYQLFGLFVILGLNVSIAGSDITRFMTHVVLDWRAALPTYAFVLFADVVLFIPSVLQVKRILYFDDRLEVQTLFWKSKVKWQDIVRFWQPAFMRVAVLKTKRGLYLINPKDIDGFDDLLGKVKKKLA